VDSQSTFFVQIGARLHGWHVFLFWLSNLPKKKKKKKKKKGKTWQGIPDDQWCGIYNVGEVGVLDKITCNCFWKLELFYKYIKSEGVSKYVWVNSEENR
jgi:predicted peroxiredoxin